MTMDPLGGGNSDFPEPQLIGTTTVASGSGAPSLVEVDQFGNYYINGSLAPLNNAYTRQIIQDAILNGPDGAGAGGGGLTPNQAAQIAQRQAEFDEGIRQFDAQFGLSEQQLTQNAQEFAAELNLDREQFNANLAQRQAEQRDRISQFNIQHAADVAEANARLGLEADTTNAQLAQRAAEANQAAALQVAQTNAQLRAQQASLAEQIRKFDQADARAAEQMRFAVLRQDVATQENNRAAMQNAQSIIANVQGQIENIRLQRQSAVTQVQSLNAQIENNVRAFNAQEQARVEELNEARRQANLEQLADVSETIGELAQNPADVGKLAGFLRAGNPAAITSAITRGENAITDESLLGLRGLLGVRNELQEGPTEATANLIEGEFVDVPEFGDIGLEVPELADLFREIQFDPNAFEFAPGAQGPGDLSQFFAPIAAPDAIIPGQVGIPDPIQAQQIQMSAGAGALPEFQLPQLPAPGAGATTPSGFGLDGINEIITAADPRNTNPNPNALPTMTPAAFEQNVGPLGPRGQTFVENFTQTSPNVPIHIGSSLTPQQIEDFFAGFEHGGTAPPGMPVVVGDSSDGKENQELAMVDAMGNLVVAPIDALPQAQNGGIFEGRRRNASNQLGRVDAEPIGAVSPTPRFMLGGNDRQLVRTTAQPTLPDFESELTSAPQESSAAFLNDPTDGIFGDIGPVSPEEALAFLSDVQRDALRRGGFTDPTQISPIRVSAPGTSNFLQELSASVAGTLGFGPRSLFFEELARLTPRGVRSGIAHRTR